MAATGKAAVFHGPGKPFELTLLPLPEVEPRAVLIRVSVANICGSALHFWRGDARLKLPDDGWIYGHEMCGRVARLGAEIKTDSLGEPLKEGDRVAYCYFYPCGRCYACLNKEPASCPNKVGRPMGPRTFPHFHGAFAEYYYLRPGGFLFKVPDELSDEIVAPVNCALSQVIYGLHVAGLRFGDSVVIQGAGGLGVQAAAVAKEMGAAGGTISRGGTVEIEPSLLVWGSKKIVGVIQYDPWVIPRALDFLIRTRGRFPFARLLSHKYSLHPINEAFAA